MIISERVTSSFRSLRNKRFIDARKNAIVIMCEENKFRKGLSHRSVEFGVVAADERILELKKRNFSSEYIENYLPSSLFHATLGGSK